MTKTLLDEPPRLRHQISELLSNDNNEIYFCEKPLNILDFKKIKINIQYHKKNFYKFTIRELINHNFRLIPLFHYLNAIFTNYFLEKQLIKNRIKPDLIINFNYDYFWLKKSFSKIPIFTIINDDFEGMARLPFFGYITWALRKTCKMSDKVLTVSPVIAKRLSLWCKPELFLPWSQNRYQIPEKMIEKNVILYWGYINERLDFDMILNNLEDIKDKGFKLRFIGPIQKKISKLIIQLEKNPAFEILPQCDFKDLKTDDCFAAILPYKLNDILEKCYIPNKALNLLSLGLPLIAFPSKNLYKANFIINYSTKKFPEISDAAEEAKYLFLELQEEIKSFVNSNLALQRLKQFKNIQDKFY